MSSRNQAHESPEVVWHDIECGSYAADLGVWEELAERNAREDGASDVLDLGSGTGRVSLFLARLGHRITGLDRDPVIAAALNRRAAAAGPPVAAVVADAVSFELAARFDLVIAPMQLLQLVPDRAGRKALLERSRAHLLPGGRFATALLDLSGEPLDGDYVPPVPDMRERDGWVYSSQPVAIRMLDGGSAISLDRLRRAVSPTGDLHESVSEIRLELLSPDELEAEAVSAGLEPESRITIPPTEDHVGSVVVVARAAHG